VEAVAEDDYADIENYVLYSAASSSLRAMRPLFPRWQSFLQSHGVDRVSVGDARASTLIVLLIKQGAAPDARDAAFKHHMRNMTGVRPGGCWKP
jgi:hypothetical protein